MPKIKETKSLLNCILIIDDDPVSLFICHELISSLNIASNVKCCSDGEEALEFLSTCTPALILVDLVMNGMDGYEFIHKINNHHERGKINVVAISSHLRKLDKEKLQSLKIYTYMEKPLSEDKILEIAEAKNLT